MGDHTNRLTRRSARMARDKATKATSAIGSGRGICPAKTPTASKQRFGRERQFLTVDGNRPQITLGALCV
jgi:hypothetical protein